MSVTENDLQPGLNPTTDFARALAAMREAARHFQNASGYVDSWTDREFLLGQAKSLRHLAAIFEEFPIAKRAEQ